MIVKLLPKSWSEVQRWFHHDRYAGSFSLDEIDAAPPLDHDCFLIEIDGKVEGALIASIQGKRLVIEHAAGEFAANVKDVIAAVLSGLRKYAAENGLKAVQFETARAGLTRVAAGCGYAPVSIVSEARV